MSRIGSFLRRPVVLAAAGLLVIAVGVGAFWFQPWKLFTNTTVDEPPPTVAVDAPAPGVPADTPTVLADGSFISHEHETTGTVKLLRLPDGSQVVRLENLDTSDGPQLVVLLSNAPVIEGRDGWRVFEDSRHVDLGKLKGNRGSANYVVPADVDVTGLDSVSIWCDRFNVSFGAAELVRRPDEAAA